MRLAREPCELSGHPKKCSVTMQLSTKYVDLLRSQFPALKKQVNGLPAVFFDGPAGTQVPQTVIDAISNYLVNCNANSHGVFLTSSESDRVIGEAHDGGSRLSRRQ